MDVNDIEDILHQCRPYLMVDKVLEIDKTQIKTMKIHHGDEAHVAGHFPGAPVVPGAMLQEFCTQSAGILITKFYSPIENYSSKTTRGWALGVLNRITSAKFLEITKIDMPIYAEVEIVESSLNLFKFRAKIFQDDRLKAKMSFNLVNISDDYLK
jgi:3-hydroxyacyl-[acyl-carrier-protein] dehydratase